MADKAGVSQFSMAMSPKGYLAVKVMALVSGIVGALYLSQVWGVRACVPLSAFVCMCVYVSG